VRGNWRKEEYVWFIYGKALRSGEITGFEVSFYSREGEARRKKKLTARRSRNFNLGVDGQRRKGGTGKMG